MLHNRYTLFTIMAVMLVLATSLVTLHPAMAKSSVPSLTLEIRQNAATQHNYFAPTFLCIRGRTANVTIKNDTKQAQVILWNTEKQVTVKAGKSSTALQHAQDKGIDNPYYEIDILLNPHPVQETQEAVAYIAADGVVSSCIGR